jgi:four helix bundle protein
MGLKSYRELEVWQRAMDMVVAVYKISAKFPADEKFGLKSQMQRAAVSIPANIAEGYGRTHRGDYLQHLSVARGSLAELETHLTIAVRLDFVARAEAATVWEQAQRVGQMLEKLTQSLREKAPETKTQRTRSKASSSKYSSRDPEPETRDPIRQRNQPD